MVFFISFPSVKFRVVTWIRNLMCMKAHVEKSSVVLSNLLLSCVDGNINYFKQLDCSEA